jgi:Phycobilisome degradation protein nblA
MENPQLPLTLDDEFKITLFNMQVKDMSKEQAQYFLVQCHQLYVAMRRLYLEECERNLPTMASHNELNRRPTTEEF